MGLFCGTLSLVLLQMFKLQLKIACSKLSESRDEARRVRRWREKEGRAPALPLPSFLTFFSCSRFRGPDYLGVWNRLN